MSDSTLGSPSRSSATLLAACFFLTGAAGLVYEIVWARHLALLYAPKVAGAVAGTLLAGFVLGDRLILYSDGLIEALDDRGEPFGFERFERVLSKHGAGSAAGIRQALLDAVSAFTRNRPPEDDQTLVVVSFEDAAEEALRAS